jgi:hypothetical protein
MKNTSQDWAFAENRGKKRQFKPKHPLAGAKQMPMFGSEDWVKHTNTGQTYISAKKAEWLGFEESLRHKQQMEDLAAKIKGVAAAAGAQEKPNTLAQQASRVFNKLEKGIFALRRDLTAKVQRSFATPVNQPEHPTVIISPDGKTAKLAPPAAPTGWKITKSAPFTYSRKLAAGLSAEADRILRGAEETLRHRREKGEWKWTTVPGQPGEKVGESERKVKFKKAKPEKQPWQKSDSRGYSIGDAPKKGRKGFEPKFQEKSGHKVGYEGVDWFLEREKQPNPEHAKKVKAYVNVSAPALLSAVAVARLGHLKQKNPERYKKERAIAGAALGMYGAYKVGRVINRGFRDWQSVKGMF